MVSIDKYELQSWLYNVVIAYKTLQKKSKIGKKSMCFEFSHDSIMLKDVRKISGILGLNLQEYDFSCDGSTGKRIHFYYCDVEFWELELNNGISM